MINDINEYCFDDDMVTDIVGAIDDDMVLDTISVNHLKPKKASYWSDWVTNNSGAMCLPEGIFTWQPQQIAEGLYQAVMESNNTKGTKFQSAMSMLNFYINRAGKKLPPTDKLRLEAAKIELRRVFGKIK